MNDKYITNPIFTFKQGLLDYDLKKIRSRITLMIALVLAAFLIVAFRLTNLSLIGDISHSPKIVNSKKIIPYAPRANILDINGNIVTTSLKMPIVYIDPSIAVHSENIASDLSQIIPLTKEDILRKIKRGGRFVAIYHGITPKQQQAINNLGYPSIGFKDSFRRVYPEKNLLSHIVGYTNIDGEGIAGIEKQFNDKLLSQDDIKLTIDIRLQHILRSEIEKTITHFEAIGGSGIIMDVNNGDILAMVSLPDFDPHNPQMATDDELFNRNSLGVFEMGSTFKIFSIAAALENNVASLSDRFDVSKDFKINSYTIRDLHKEKELLSFAEVFTHSSNIGTALLAEKLGTEKLKNFYKKLGLFDRIEVELPERARPLLPKKWREINTITASYGHGIAVTPLHLAVATASIVNGGKKVKAHIIKQNNKKNNAKKEERIVSTKTSEIMRKFLREVVISEKGTGKKAFVAGYDVGGKTGTSEKIKKGGKKYDKKLLFSSFLGVFPMYSPKYLVLINIDEPKGQKDTYNFATGGWVAAPAVGNVIKKMVSIIGISPNYEYDRIESKK